MENIKKCAKCGKNFEKKINVSRKKWETIKCCSKSCAKKGVSSWNKGIPLSEERKLHLHKVLLGRICNTGRTHIKKGQRLSLNTEFKKGDTPWSKGKKLLYQTGSNNHNWKGGVTSEHQKIRHSPEIKQWREDVFKRDNYTCVLCKRKRKVGDRVVLQADHIKSFSKYPELRFVLENGRTLCQECHRKTESYGVNTSV